MFSGVLIVDSEQLWILDSGPRFQMWSIVQFQAHTKHNKIWKRCESSLTTEAVSLNNSSIPASDCGVHENFLTCPDTTFPHSEMRKSFLSWKPYTPRVRLLQVMMYLMLPISLQSANYLASVVAHLNID